MQVARVLWGWTTQRESLDSVKILSPTRLLESTNLAVRMEDFRSSERALFHSATLLDLKLISWFGSQSIIEVSSSSAFAFVERQNEDEQCFENGYRLEQTNGSGPFYELPNEGPRNYIMRYKLPDGVLCGGNSRCVLRWWWETENTPGTFKEVRFTVYSSSAVYSLNDLWVLYHYNVQTKKQGSLTRVFFKSLIYLRSSETVLIFKLAMIVTVSYRLARFQPNLHHHYRAVQVKALQ